MHLDIQIRKGEALKNEIVGSILRMIINELFLRE